MNKLRNIALAGVLAASALVAGPSMAAISGTDIQTAATAITTDAQTVFTNSLPVLFAVLGLVIGYKLIKRFLGGAV